MERKQAAVAVTSMIHKLQHELINVFEVDMAPVETYLKSY